MRRNFIKRMIVLGIISTTLLSLVPIGASAEWRQDNLGWWYAEGNSYANNEWKQIDGNYYYFYDGGYMAHDAKIDGYYLNSSGVWSTNEPSPEFTYEQALEIIKKKYENNSDVILSGTPTPNYINDEKYYSIHVASKSSQAAGGTGTLFNAHVFADGRIEK